MIKESIARIRSSIEQFPAPVKSFLVRALILFLVWKFLYMFFWQEKGTLDDPLTELAAHQTAWVLNLLTEGDEFTVREVNWTRVIEGEPIPTNDIGIFRNEKRIMLISHSCNGLELFILYIGFIIAMPASFSRKLLFSLGGLVIIHVANIIRCVGLGFLVMHWRQFFDVAHHYVFKIVVYGTIFLLWVWYSKKISLLTTSENAV
jgi:exosortase family protein XrtF